MASPTLRTFPVWDGGFTDRLTSEYFQAGCEKFTKIVAATNRHFWDPSDGDYIDFGVPFDLGKMELVPFDLVPELCCPVAEMLTPQQRREFANDSVHLWLSGFLHGEQGALSLSLSLCEVLGAPDAVEYAANQAREEARHVAAFTRYIRARWGSPAPVSPAFKRLLDQIVSAKEIHRKIVGMQLLVEGLSMGFMAALYRRANDPVLVRLAQLVMTDEAFHHKAGQLWAEDDFPYLNEAQRLDAEDWALECFNVLMFNVFNPSQKIQLYKKYGLDPELVRSHMRNYYTEEVRRQEFADRYGVFRVLVKTLLRSGIVTDRTRSHYARWLDPDVVCSESDDAVELLISAEGLLFLDAVNRQKGNRRDLGGSRVR